MPLDWVSRRGSSMRMDRSYCTTSLNFKLLRSYPQLNASQEYQLVKRETAFIAHERRFVGTLQIARFLVNLVRRRRRTWRSKPRRSNSSIGYLGWPPTFGRSPISVVRLYALPVSRVEDS